MRRAAVCLALSLVAAVPVQAAPVPPGFASPNVEWLANIPLNADSSGARIVGKYLYTTDSRSVTIYDISTPERPIPVGSTPSPQVPTIPQEDVETNGEILVVSQSSLFVYDVRNKALPMLVGTLQGAGSHTTTCVLSCRYLYNSDGGIVDLREPAAPRLAGDWRTGTRVTSAHDLTEVSPGIVVSSSRPLLVLDARRNPAKPKVLASTSPPNSQFIHGNIWPRGGTDRWLLVGGETSGGSCSDPESGSFMVLDTKDWRRTGRFRLADEWWPKQSVNPAEGGYPVATWCAHWFSTRPGFRNGGLVAMGWYERGTRFLRVSPKGQVSEAGWFLPAGASASAAYWASKDIVYVLDYQRGLDVLRFHDSDRAPSRAPAGRGLPPTKAPLFPAVLAPTFAGFCPAPR